MQRRFDINRTSPADHEGDLLAELRSSLTLLLLTIGILFLASAVGVALS